jgi:thioredoxin 1
MITELDENNFEDKVSKGSVIIDFYADWCAPCHVMKPVFEKASNEFKKVIFYKVNVDKSQSISSQFSIRSLPTILLLKNGEEVNRVTGVIYEEKLKEKIREAFK